MKKFLKTACRIICFIGLYLLMQELFSFLCGIVYEIKYVVENQGRHLVLDPVKMQAAIQAMVEQYILIILIGSILGSLLIYFLVFRARQENLFRICNFSAIKIGYIGLAILLGAAFNWSLTMLDSLTSFYKLFPAHEKLMERLMGGGFFFTIIIIGLAVPFFEEILFRGIVFNELRKHFSVGAAIIVQGLLFGIYHLNLLQSIYGTILGLIAALVYIWFNSLWAPILVHAAFNTLSVILSRVGSDQLLNKDRIALLIISVLVLGESIFLAWKHRNSKAGTLVSKAESF